MEQFAFLLSFWILPRVFDDKPRLLASFAMTLSSKLSPSRLGIFMRIIGV